LIKFRIAIILRTFWGEFHFGNICSIKPVFHMKLKLSILRFMKHGSPWSTQNPNSVESFCV